MKGIILINAFSSIGESQANRLQEEFNSLGQSVEIVRNLPKNLNVDIDFCIFLDKDIYSARILEKRGVRLFNNAKAVEICDDKVLTYVVLDGIVPEPPTVPCSFSYLNASALGEEIGYVEETLGYPLVLKICKQSRGEGVFLIDSRNHLIEAIEKYRTTPHLYQKYISYAKGRDTRVIVIGKKVVASMSRQNPNDFRSNVEVGGECLAVSIDDKMQEIAVKVSEVLDLDYCGIDFLTDEFGNHYVCEVNSNAFFKGIERATKVNVARAYATHVLSQLQQK